MSLNYCFVLNFICKRCLICVSISFLLCVLLLFIMYFYFAWYYGGWFYFNCMNLRRPKPHLLFTHPPLASCRAILSIHPVLPTCPCHTRSIHSLPRATCKSVSFLPYDLHRHPIPDSEDIMSTRHPRLKLIQVNTPHGQRKTRLAI